MEDLTVILSWTVLLISFGMTVTHGLALRHDRGIWRVERFLTWLLVTIVVWIVG